MDIGTSSARAGVFLADGGALGASERPFRIWQDGPDRAEANSGTGWSAVCAAVRDACAEIGKVELDMVQSDRESLNLAIKEALAAAGDDYGILISRSEIKDVALTETTRRAMAEVLEAERFDLLDEHPADAGADKAARCCAWPSMRRPA